MKKLAVFIMTVAMVFSLFALEAFAEGISRIDCGIDIDLKKTDPALVQKDGVIGENEYEEYMWTGDLETGECNLTMQWGAGGHVHWIDMVEMGKSSHWYFSWDEVHGFNFAVVITIPEGGFHTNFPQNELNNDGHIVDSFMGNVGLNIWNSTELFNQKFPGALYYSIGRDITTGNYLKGHIGTLGNRGTFDPVGGVDYSVNYVGRTATFEWSIPFADFIVSDAGKNIVVEEGLQFPFSITVTAGAKTPEDSGNYHDESYGIQFGQNAWFLDQANRDRDSAWFTVTNEMIGGTTVDTTEATTADTGAVENTTSGDAVSDSTSENVTTNVDFYVPTAPDTTEIVTSYVTSQIAVTDDLGNEVTDESGAVVTEVVVEVVSSVVTDAPTEIAGEGEKAPVTADPAVIAAIAVVISACGAVVAKKKK